MIKFWKEDFTYINDFLTYNGDYYEFSVRGESANYLINKYDLDYQNIELHLFTDDNTMTVTSRTESGLNRDISDVDKEDIQELLPILQEEINMYLRNY